MAIFQSTTIESPQHQAGLLVIGKDVFRPRLNRVVLERELSEPKVYRRPTQHAHAVYHIFLAHEGVACITHHGELQELHAGELLCVSPGEPHHVMVNQRACRYSAITFDFIADASGVPLVLPLPELLSVMRGELLAAPADWPRLQARDSEDGLRNAYRKMYSGACRSPLVGAHELSGFLLQLTRLGFQPTGTTAATEPHLEAVRRHIQEYYSERLVLDTLAAEFGFSRRSLTRKFRDAFGTSPISYQLRLRLEAAQLMLGATNMQIQEIAAEVGFTDVYQFSRAFHKHVGQSPTEFRRSQ